MQQKTKTKFIDDVVLAILRICPYTFYQVILKCIEGILTLSPIETFYLQKPKL